MASKKKITKQEEIVAKEPVLVDESNLISEEEVKTPEAIVEKKEKPKKSKEPTKTIEKSEKSEKSPKYAVGSIVYVSKDAEADLNGFKLFPPYKKYTYTVEAYDAISGVYSLRRLNLSLKLKEVNIVAPSERAHDSLNRKQF